MDEAEAAAKRKKEELDREIDLIKKEYAEKLKDRKKSKGSNEKKKDGEKSKEDKSVSSKEDDKDDEKAEKEKNDKVRKPASLSYISNSNLIIGELQIEAVMKKESTSTSDEGPRIFALQKYSTLCKHHVKLSR